MSSSLEHFRKISIVERSPSFRAGARVVEASLPLPPPEGTVYVRSIAMGFNAAELFMLGGVYGASPLPHDCGLEGMGEVVAVAADVTNVKTGDKVMYFTWKTFAEYVTVPAAACMPITDAEAADDETVVMMLSGLTAACALGETAAPKRGGLALVTAAAGGTGHIAVQLLRHVYGCRVIGTCSTPEKAAFLRDTLGCDDVINYRTESLDEALTRLAPDGFDLIYECIGGETLATCARHMAVYGQLLMIGAVDTYQKGGKDAAGGGDAALLFQAILKSASFRGFFLGHYEHVFQKYLDQMRELRKEGKLILKVDSVYHGFESAPDAVEKLQSGKTFGKLILKP